MTLRKGIALLVCIISSVMLLAVGLPDADNPPGFWFFAVVASLVWMLVEKLRSEKQGR